MKEAFVLAVALGAGACARPSAPLPGTPISPVAAPVSPGAPPVVAEDPPAKIHEGCRAEYDAAAKNTKALRLTLTPPAASIRVAGPEPRTVSFELRNDSDDPAALSLFDDQLGKLSVRATIGTTSEPRAISFSERDPHAPGCRGGQRVLTLDPHAAVTIEMKLSAVQHMPGSCTCRRGLCGLRAPYDEPMKKGTYPLTLHDASGAELRFDKDVKLEVVTALVHVPPR